jgi:3-oxoacyl-[acyl-carrier protein] reductase
MTQSSSAVTTKSRKAATKSQARHGNGIRPLEGKVAVVTGGSRGIGAAIARRLAADGAKVVVNYAAAKDAAETVAREIQADSGEAVVVQGDVAKPGSAEKIKEAALKAFGKIDILVNNAGVFEMAPLAETTPERVARLFSVNVFGLFEMTRAAADLLPEGGRIINVSSIAGRAALPGFSAYCATKAAVDSITRCLAAELGPKGITVNAVAPGTTETDMLPKDPQFVETFIAKTPLGRLGQADDVADLVAFLASEDARWVTGQVIDVSGGLRP